MRAKAVESGLVQHGPVVGMGNGNEQLGTFLQGFSVQVYGSVFRDNPVGIGPRGYHAGTGIQHRDNLGLALVGARCEGRYGLAALGHGGAFDEVQLAAGA